MLDFDLLSHHTAEVLGKTPWFQGGSGPLDTIKESKIIKINQECESIFSIGGILKIHSIQFHPLWFWRIGWAISLYSASVYIFIPFSPRIPDSPFAAAILSWPDVAMVTKTLPWLPRRDPGHFTRTKMTVETGLLRISSAPPLRLFRITSFPL